MENKANFIYEKPKSIGYGGEDGFLESLNADLSKYSISIWKELLEKATQHPKINTPHLTPEG